jgi:hypothetical protein
MNKSQAIRLAFLEQDDPNNYLCYQFVVKEAQYRLKESGNKKDIVTKKDLYNVRGNVLRKFGTKRLTKEHIRSFDSPSGQFPAKYTGQKGKEFVSKMQKVADVLMTPELRKAQDRIGKGYDFQVLTNTEDNDIKLIDAIHAARDFVSEVGSMDEAEKTLKLLQKLDY